MNPQDEVKRSQTFDWTEVRRKLDETRSAIENGFTYSEKEKRDILKERARNLARRPADDRKEADNITVTEFLLADEHYAFESKHIRGIYQIKELTPLPCTPSFIFGIVNIHGEIISVSDIKKFFDLPEKGITNLNKIIVIQTRQMELGILADEIIGAKTVSVKDIQASLPTLTGIREKYLKGVTKDRLIILDAVKIASDKSIIVDEGLSNEKK
ncbi:MAG TPA: chemotaxis protein CheW [Candidatus Marinimicrobia bacterium]|nr:chemotaxis protein CheW [Candidatus Neomarinimicrobiota bacterium]